MRGALTRISDLVHRWTEATERPRYRWGGVAIGLLLAAGVLALPTPAAMTPEAHRCAAVALLMATWWVGRVLPMAVTALVPLVAFPVLGVTDAKSAALPYANPLNFLMLGGFVLGAAMQRVGLHQRLVAAILAPAAVREHPRRVVLGLMVACGLLSGLVSNTATTVMLLPMAMSLAAMCVPGERERAVFPLALAYSASIGGVSTLIGTPPNAVLANEVEGITFASWLLVGLPFVALALPTAWLILTRIAVPLPDRSEDPPDAPRVSRPKADELLVIGVIAVAMFLWLTRKPIDLSLLTVPGWGDAFGGPKVTHDAMVAVLAAGVLFLLPGVGQGRAFLMDWRETERAIPWSVLLLLGGGFSLAEGIKASQLTAWLAGATTSLAALTRPGAFGNVLGPESTELLGTALGMLMLCLVMTFLTELTSNTATTQIVLPILAAGAMQAGLEPLYWMVPATVSASCAFMMPVATAPNAIATEAGGVSPGDMAWAGLLLNLACAVLAAGVSFVVVRYVLL